MSKLKKLVAKELSAKSINDLSTDGLVLFNLMVLITDIKFRKKYGEKEKEKI
jgi:hypothetical protein